VRVAARSARRPRRSRFQPALIPLRTMARCLRGMAFMFFSHRVDGPAEGDVEIAVAHSAWALRSSVLSGDTQLLASARRRRRAPARAFGRRRHAAVDAKGQRDERVPEQEALTSARGGRSIRPRPRRKKVARCPNARSMTVFHPADGRTWPQGRPIRIRPSGRNRRAELLDVQLRSSTCGYRNVGAREQTRRQIRNISGRYATIPPGDILPDDCFFLR